MQGVLQTTGTGERGFCCDLLPRRGQRAAGCSAARVPCSGRCGFAVAGRWSGALAAERRSAEQAHATRRTDGTRVRTACMPLGRVGVRRRVGPCAAAGAVCVGMARGCREAKKRVPHACRCGRGSRLAPRPRARGNPLCVCAPHSPAHFAGCAAREAGAGSGVRERREPARDATRAAVDHRILVCVRPPGWRGRAPWSQRDARRSATASLRTGALPADEKSSNWSSRAKPTSARSRRHASRPGARVPREARLPRGARAPGQKKKKKAAARRAPTAEEAHRMHARNQLFPRSSKRHAAPRARAGGHAARSSDCGGEAGGGLGGNGERRWRGRCDVDRRPSRGAGRARAARSGLCRPPPGYFFTFPG